MCLKASPTVNSSILLRCQHITSDLETMPVFINVVSFGSAFVSHKRPSYGNCLVTRPVRMFRVMLMWSDISSFLLLKWISLLYQSKIVTFHTEYMIVNCMQ